MNASGGLWSAAGKVKNDLNVTQGSISAKLDDIRRQILDKEMQAKPHIEFGRKAWLHINKSSCAWITACPKVHTSPSMPYSFRWSRKLISA
jgi:hypothetical protein